MTFTYLKLGFEISDKDFDKIYPQSIQQFSDKYWTPVNIAVQASRFLVKDTSTRVLDIGSGAGKFCMIGATVTGAYFTGAEPRKYLSELSINIIQSHNLQNITILDTPLSSINLKQYDAFYLFNPFRINPEEDDITGASVQEKMDTYHDYALYVKSQLEQMPEGTKVVTYQGHANELPPCYTLHASYFNNQLKYWIKQPTLKHTSKSFEEILVRQGITRLKALGFTNVNESNIWKDEVYKTFFEKILRSQLGKMEFTDQALNDLIKRLSK